MHRCRHRPYGSVVALRARAGGAARQRCQRCSTTRLPAHRAHSELAPWAPLATSGSEDCRAGDHPRRTRDKRHTVDLPPPHRIRFAVGASGRMHTSCWGSGGGGGSAAGSRGRTREKCAPSRARRESDGVGCFHTCILTACCRVLQYQHLWRASADVT